MKKIQQNEVIELSFVSTKNYKNPFYDIDFSTIFIFPDGTEKRYRVSGQGKINGK